MTLLLPALLNSTHFFLSGWFPSCLQFYLSNIQGFWNLQYLLDSGIFHNRFSPLPFMTLNLEPSGCFPSRMLNLASCLGKYLALSFLSLNYVCIGSPLLQKLFFIWRVENSLAMFWLQIGYLPERGSLPEGTISFTSFHIGLLLNLFQHKPSL